MCLLIVKPAGANFPSNWTDMCVNASISNDDGCGYASPRTHFRSVSIKPKEFAAKVRTEVRKDEAAIIHFRFGTGGRVNIDNCHPFKIKDGTYFAHNGIISDVFPSTAEHSDTAMLGMSVDNIGELEMVCTELGSPGNKFAILNPFTNEVQIIGEKHGSWDQGLWFSNCGYKKWNYSVSGWTGSSSKTNTHRDVSRVPMGHNDHVDTYDMDWIELEDDVNGALMKHGDNQFRYVFETVKELVVKYGFGAVSDMMDFTEIGNKQCQS